MAEATHRFGEGVVVGEAVLEFETTVGGAQVHQERLRARMALVQTRLDAIGPQATLQRGYAIVRKADGSIVRRVEQVGSRETLIVNVSDGAFDVVTVNRQ